MLIELRKGVFIAFFRYKNKVLELKDISSVEPADIRARSTIQRTMHLPVWTRVVQSIGSAMAVSVTSGMLH